MIKKYFKKINKSNGFTLVETLIAISIFSVSIVAMMSILGSGISDTNYAKKKITASYLAQEGIEYVRNQRDTKVLSGTSSQAGWDDFKTFCIAGISYPTDSDFTSFTRIITTDTTSFGNDEVRISSEVRWTQGSGLQSITFSENLFNWVE